MDAVEELAEMEQSALLINEKSLQAAVMIRAMRVLQHELVVPNSRDTFFHRESDVLSVTRAGLIHEYEIKISAADYKRDAAKWHMTPSGPVNAPAYFWYVTSFEIEPPAFAGWLLAVADDDGVLRLQVKKDAPRLNNTKMSEADRCTVARLLSFRVTNLYERFFREDVAAYREAEKVRELKREVDKQRRDADFWHGLYKKEVLPVRAELQTFEIEWAIANRDPVEFGRRMEAFARRRLDELGIGERETQ